MRAATSISALTLISRLLGLARDVVMFRLLGTGWINGTFMLAWMAPNLLRRLFGEGALGASFVPAYAATLDRDGGKPARALLGTVAGTVCVVLAALTLLVWLLCAVLPSGWVGEADASGASAEQTGALLLQLTAILFPYVLLVSLTAIASGALNVHGVFGWPAAMPIVLNVFWIAGLVVATAVFGDDGAAVVALTSWFLLAGGIAQLGLVGWQLGRRGALARPHWPPPGDPARAVFVRMGPTVVGMSMLQLNTLLDQGFAYWLIGPGANTYVYMANRLLLFPHALTALALATAVFPRFALLASRAAMADLAERVASAQRATMFLTVPASVGLLLVADEFLRTFFVGGAFGGAEARVAAWTTAALVAGLPWVSAAQLHARALYALGEMRAPARVATALVPLNVVLNAVLALGCGLGAPGLAAATSLCAVVNALALRQAFRLRCPGEGLGWRPLWRVVAATAAMAAVVLVVQELVPATGRTAIALAHLALPIVLGAATYALVHFALGGDELRRLLRRGVAQRALAD